MKTLVDDTYLDKFITEVDLTKYDGINELNIIHFSDLHFSRTTKKPHDRYHDSWNKKLGTDDNDLYQDLLKALSKGPQPHVCIISGDLTQNGRKDAYKAVFDNINSLAANWFESNLDRFIIIPGNHDIKWFKTLTPGKQRNASQYKAALAKYYKNPNELNNLLAWNGNCFWDIKLFKCNGFSVLICGIDSTLIETRARRGIGYISDHQMEKLSELLGSKGLLSDDKCIKLAVIHHHVLPVSYDIKVEYNAESGIKNIHPALTYDARRFLTWLGKNKFSMVLHGHQHDPFLTTEHERRKRKRELIISGVGSVCKIGHPNSFNTIQISPEKGIIISTYNSTDLNSEFEKNEKHWHFPILQYGPFISLGLSHILDELHEFCIEQGGGSGDQDHYRNIRLTDKFGGDTISLILKEILLAIGIVKEKDNELILTHVNDFPLPVSFLKIFSRYLKNRGNDGRTLIQGWTNRANKMFKETYSPLRFLSHLEKEWFENKPEPDDLRKDDYILYPLFCWKKVNHDKYELNILLHKHKMWQIYLIPARKTDAPEEHLDHLFEFKGRLKAKDCFMPLPKACEINEIDVSRKAKPSPSRALLTNHNYAMYFYSLNDKGLGNLIVDNAKRRWFSRSECEQLKYIELDEPEREICYGKKGLFHNNLDFLNYAFKMAEKLIEDNVLTVYEDAN